MVMSAKQAQRFRSAYLTHAELSHQLRTWADQYPDILRLQELGRSREGRELWLVTVGREPQRERPSVWIDGNMHAGELAGSSVVLAIIEDLICLHTQQDACLHGLPPGLCGHLRALRFFLVPRVAPDGAELVVTGAGQVRSSPFDNRETSRRPRWRVRDVNGDGVALVMRQVDPTGEFCASTLLPDLMVPRELDDPGPYYKIYPEGHIENFDGHTIPEPGGPEEGGVDYNRNFPWSWAPEPQQSGAGAYPGSEPEVATIVAFTSRQPTIFAWFNYHTFGGVFIRPLGHALDHEMMLHDLMMFRQLEVVAKRETGYPTVCGYKEFTYVAGKPLHGDAIDYAYHQRGSLAVAIELWDVFERAGIGPRKRFVERYATLTRPELEAIALWDRRHNQGRCIRPWVPFDHPQLGPVEVGGVDPRFGLWNPPTSYLAEVCRAQAAVVLRVAAMAPRLCLAKPCVTDLGGGRSRIQIAVENHGYLPTCGLESARELPWNEGLTAVCRPQGDIAIEAPGQPYIDIGHLDGWGRGPFGEDACLYYQRSRGSTGRKHLQWIVRGHGEVEVEVSGPRVGSAVHRFVVPSPKLANT